jgi:molecular chaperone GrpE
MSDKPEKPVEIDLGAAEASPPEAKPAEPTAAGEAASSDLPTPVPPTAEDRIAALEAEKSELRDRMMRIAADFDNWKKRSRKEQTDAESRAREGILRDFLEVVDNLERATASLGDGKESDAKSVRDGVDLVLRQFRSKLERHQVKPIDSVGQPFDPRLHEAISRLHTTEVAPGSVAREYQKGYLIGDKLLRPAMVVVATAPPADAPPAEAAAPPDASPARSEGED